MEHGVLGRHLVLAIFVLNERGEFLYYLDRIILSVDHHRHFNLKLLIKADFYIRGLHPISELRTEIYFIDIERVV